MSHLTKPAAVAALLFACAGACAAQSGTAGPSGLQGPPAAARRGGGVEERRASADESFELNIDERRISELDFFAATEVAAGGEEAGGVSLRVGVSVGAGRIEALLRNVRGRVRFRGSLEPLRRVLGPRAALPAAAETGASPPARAP